MPVYEMKTLEAQLDETLLTDRLIALLSAGFGLLATVLASVGLYGVMAFVVARRRKELGIRLALGAQPAFVIWLVMREVCSCCWPSASRSAFRRRSRSAATCRRSSTASSRTIRGSRAARWSLLPVVSAAAGLDPGDAREPHRSDPRAALRVGSLRASGFGSARQAPGFRLQALQEALQEREASCRPSGVS